MKTVRVKVDLKDLSTLPKGRVDRKRLEATLEKDIQLQKRCR